MTKSAQRALAEAIVARYKQPSDAFDPEEYVPDAAAIIHFLRLTGFAVVPVIPVEDMLLAAEDELAGMHLNFNHRFLIMLVFEAMIAAADGEDPPPQSRAERAARKVLSDPSSSKSAKVARGEALTQRHIRPKRRRR